MKPKKASKQQIIPPKKKNNQGANFSVSGTWFFLRPQNIFLILSTVFGLCFVFTIPPFQVPDEGVHMFRAYQLSEFQMKVEEQNNVFGNYLPPSPDNKVVGTYLPASLDSAQMQFFHLKFRPQNKIKRKTISEACSIKLQPEKEKFIEMTGNYSFISYLPQIPAIFIGRMLNLNVLYIFYLGRIVALAFFILCVWYSIKVIPFGKYTLMVLGLIPMSLSLAGSFSGDCVIISFSFLAVALSLYFVTQKEVEIKNIKLILLISVLCLIGVLKLVYLPFIVIALLIPRRLFVFKREYYLMLFIILLFSTTLSVGWNYIMNAFKIPNPDIVVKEIVETPSHQLRLILQNPLLIFDILNQTLTAKWEFYNKSLIGILGYLDTMLPRWIFNAYYFVILIVALLDFHKSHQLSAFQRILIFITSIGMSLVTIIAMFIFDGQESGSSLVAEGVQGRYFIPPLILFVFALYKLLPIKQSVFENYKIASIILFLFCFVVLYQTEIALYLRYFKEGDAYFKYIGV